VVERILTKGMLDTTNHEPPDLSEERYLDSDDVTDAEWGSYLEARHKGILGDYKTLICQRREADASENQDLANQILGLLRKNFKTRKWIAKELQKLGRPSEDMFSGKERPGG
jgi:hypothetical protein